jgi:hypothetical protein
MKFDTGEFYEKIPSHFSRPLDRAALTTTSHKAYMRLCSYLESKQAKYLSKRKLFQTEVADKGERHLLRSVHFSRRSVLLKSDAVHTFRIPMFSNHGLPITPEIWIVPCSSAHCRE